MDFKKTRNIFKAKCEILESSYELALTKDSEYARCVEFAYQQIKDLEKLVMRCVDYDVKDELKRWSIPTNVMVVSKLIPGSKQGRRRAVYLIADDIHGLWDWIPPFDSYDEAMEFAGRYQHE